MNPTLNFINLYSKFAFLKNGTKTDAPGGLKKTLLNLLTSIKSVTATYTQTDGTFLPGYLPQSTIFGEDPAYNSPGIGFLLGSQADLRSRAVANGWISADTLQNQPYVTTHNQDMHFTGTLEPIPGLRIILTAFRTEDNTYQTNFKYLPSANSIENLSPGNNRRLQYIVPYYWYGIFKNKRGE